MCKTLKIPRSTYYDSIKRTPDIVKNDDLEELEKTIISTFNSNRKSFGTKRIKNELNKLGVTVSRRKIGRIKWQEHGITYVYLLISSIVTSLVTLQIKIKMPI